MAVDQFQVHRVENGWLVVELVTAEGARSRRWIARDREALAALVLEITAERPEATAAPANPARGAAA